MKILHAVESYWPDVGGMPEVVKQISERLILAGHDVTVATSKNPKRTSGMNNGVKIESFNLKGNEVRGISGSQAEQKKYHDFLIKSNFDIITLFAAQQWSVDLALPILAQIKAKKIFVPTGFSRLNDPAYSNYFSHLSNEIKEFDLNIFLSNTYQDIDFARERGATKNVVIPNGADEREFVAKSPIDIRKKLGIDENDFLILLVGSHTGKKGHKEAVEIFKRARIKNSTLLIVGNSFGRGCTYSCFLRKKLSPFYKSFRRDNKKLIIKSLSREETVSAYQSSDLFLFPSNIECSPIVLFESAAAGLPFLSSEAGNSAEIAEWTGGGAILPTADKNSGYLYVDINKSAMILEKIHNDSDARKQMSENGRKSWMEKFTWEKIAGLYEEEYKKLIS